MVGAGSSPAAIALASAERDRRRHVHQVEQVVHRTAVRELGTFREAGGARRVEDRRVVVGVDVRRRATRPGRPPPSRRPSERRSSGSVAIGAHGDDVHRVRDTHAHRVQDVADPLEALVVDDEHLRAGCRRVRTPSRAVSTRRSCPTHAAPRLIGGPVARPPIPGSCASRARPGRRGRHRARPGRRRACAPGRGPREYV